MRSLQTDCLIIGTGISGLSAARAVIESGREVMMITAAPSTTECNTRYAQGGIIYQSGAFDTDALIKDILEAGCHANYLPAVKQLAELGPKLVDENLLQGVKTPFDRLPNGNFSLVKEGGHSSQRILHRGDQSGLAIEEALVADIEKSKSLRVLHSTTAVNLLMTSFHSREHSSHHEPARCFGAFVFDQKTEEVYPIFARHTILATGGTGELYLYSTNNHFSRGDGLALAYRAGCRLENLEYVQFHPTTFYHPKSRRFLITEALRGEGGVLVDQSEQRFLKKYLHDYPIPELAPRDRVARAIHQHMLKTESSCVYLDISKKNSDWVKDRFPFVYQACLEYGVDITRDPIPVVPGAHYHCGGVWSDLQGKTSVANLWAVGEVACTGVHGANRLASTSLLEGLVWGTLAGKEIGRLLSKEKPSFVEIDPWHYETTRVDSSFLTQDWLTLKHTMWNYVGLIRTDARLERAEGILRELKRGIEVFYRKAVLSDELIGLRHATTAAILILEASKRNKTSLGCYTREELEI